MDAGRLDRRLQFQKPAKQSNGAGTFTNGFAPQFERAANVKYLRGGEAVLASRLAQVSPAIVTIRNDVNARAIGGDWRAMDIRTGIVWQIKETPRETPNRAFLEFLVTSGVQA